MPMRPTATVSRHHRSYRTTTSSLAYLGAASTLTSSFLEGTKPRAAAAVVETLALGMIREPLAITARPALACHRLHSRATLKAPWFKRRWYTTTPCTCFRVALHSLTTALEVSSSPASHHSTRTLTCLVHNCLFSVFSMHCSARLDYGALVVSFFFSLAWKHMFRSARAFRCFS